MFNWFKRKYFWFLVVPESDSTIIYEIEKQILKVSSGFTLQDGFGKWKQTPRET